MMAGVSMDLSPELRARLDELLAEIGVERLSADRVSLPLDTLHALLWAAGQPGPDLRDMKPKGHC